MERRRMPSLFEGGTWYLMRLRPVSMALLPIYFNSKAGGPAPKWSGSLLA